MPTRPVAAALLLIAASGAAACGSSREQRARAAQEDQVRDLARRAAQLAESDSAAIKRSPVGRATIPNRLAPTTGALGVADSGGAPSAGAPTTGSPGELRIVSTNGAVVYTLVRDTVRMQLGDSLVRDVRRKVEAGGDSGSGFGAFLKQTMAGAVGSAMRFVVRTPVRDIRSARYEDGELRIETSSGVVNHGTFSVGGKRNKNKGGDRTVFAPADAERFVAAIDARRRALGLR